MLTHLEPDILECEVKWALGSITINKASGGDGIPVELFQILKDDAVKVLHSICQQIWKTQQCPQTGKGQFSFQSQKKAMPKNAQATAQLHSSHKLVKECSKVSKPGLSNVWTVNFQMFKLVLEKAEEPEIKLPTYTGSSKKKTREFQKNICFCIIDYVKAFDCVNHNKLWKILQEIGISDHLTCLLRNLYAGQEATEPNLEQWTGSKLWKDYDKAVLSPCVSNLYAEYIMQNARLDKALVGIKIVGGNINNLRYAEDTTLMAECKEELKSILMELKEEWKSWL